MPAFPIAAALGAAVLTGCAAGLLPRSGEAWQRTECAKLADAAERQRCLASTARTYEEFRRQSGGTP